MVFGCRWERASCDLRQFGKALGAKFHKMARHFAPCVDGSIS